MFADVYVFSRVLRFSRFASLGIALVYLFVNTFFDV
jgi:hypothetical protein